MKSKTGAKSAKKFPVSVRLRDLAKLNPCAGGLEKAKAVLGAEPELNGDIGKIAAVNDIPVPWVGKALSEGTNHRIAIKLAKKSLQGLFVLTTDKVHTNALEAVAGMLRKVNITPESIASVRLKLHVAFRVRGPSAIEGKAYTALTSALSYMEAAGKRDDMMVQAAMDCVDALAEVEAYMIAQKVKAPLYNFFVEGLADEKRERVMKRISAKKVVKARKKMDKVACKTKARRKR